MRCSAFFGPGRRAAARSCWSSPARARGGDDTGGRGVLKRMVPLWLGLPEFRGLVIGFESAAIGHGGEGALYVSLRKGSRLHVITLL